MQALRRGDEVDGNVVALCDLEDLLDAPATTGGSDTGWGTHFIAAWANLTGQDVYIAEFGWPCGGAGPVDWVVWVTDGSLPGAPGSQNFSGQWTPASGDSDTNPPATYSYIDVSDAGVVVPADQVMYFGYENPGIGGQVDFIRGAAKSKGGRPIIALPATAKGGEMSRIQPFLKEGAGVVTSRADVHYVVTEFGAVNLFGKNLRERAEALISIAHPKFQAELEAQARDRKLIA